MTTTDIELVARAKAGDEKAIGNLFKRHHLSAYRLARRIVWIHEDAQDVVQEAFIKVHRHLAGFEESSSFSTWLYSIVRNLSYNRLRRRGRVQREVAIPPETVIDSGAMRHHDPFRHLSRKELREWIMQAIDGLSNKDRDAFILREVKGLSHAQMARAMGCTVGAAKSRLHHAKRYIRAHLSEVFETESA